MQQSTGHAGVTLRGARYQGDTLIQRKDMEEQVVSPLLMIYTTSCLKKRLSLSQA